MSETNTQTPIEDIEDLPEEIRNYLKARATVGGQGPIELDDMLAGSDWDSVKNDLRSTGISAFRDNRGQERFLAADFDAEGRVAAMAAAVPRVTGKSIDFVKEVEDFRDAITGNNQDRKDFLALVHRVYRAEGAVNNAINKLAALVGGNGSYKVHSVKGQRGKSGDKKAEELVKILNWWKDNVNAKGDEHVITGDRGLKAFVRQGTRLALIEGDHFSRHIWKKGVQVPNLSTYTLPMNLQSYSAQNIEIPEGLEGTNHELFYWVPPAKFIQTLQSPKDPNLKKALDKVIDSKIRNALIKDKKYLLDPSLLIHIKHRGTPIDNYGESMIESTLTAVRYQRALDALEITTITNLINRLVIVKVGSDNDKSVYHSQTVTSGRLSLLQRIMRNVPPSAMLLWGGPDISIEQVGAHDSILELGDRYKIAERRLLMALGLPAVLMIGEGGDGKAAGWAAALGVIAQLQEVLDQYSQTFRSMAERIALENGYEEVDVVWEWHDNLLENKEAAAELILKLFQVGLISTQTALDKLDIDFGAEEARQAEDVSKGYREKLFGAPNGAQTNNPAGMGGERGGRPTKTEKPEADPQENKEKKTPEENS